MTLVIPELLSNMSLAPGLKSPDASKMESPPQLGSGRARARTQTREMHIYFFEVRLVPEIHRGCLLLHVLKPVLPVPCARYCFR